MQRAVVADLHLGQVPGDLDRFAGAVDELLRRQVGEVVLLGDLCVALVGFRRFWDDVAQRALQELDRLLVGGCRVVLVEGNRDFFLDTPELASHLTVTGPVHSFEAGGRRFLLEHGDLLNRRDHRYRFWRGLSKSPAARTWARLLPSGLARRIVRRTEARLARTNFRHRLGLPEAELRAAAARHFDAGVDVVMWGHFHRPFHLADGGRDAWVLPGWLEHGAVMWVGERGELRVGVPDAGRFVDTPAASWYQGSAVKAEAS